MKFKNRILLSVVALGMFSCYEDLGNYEYHDINEITVSGIKENYAVDVDDKLEIHPTIEGSQYSDTSRFSYQWEIDRRVKGNSFNLDLVVDLLPGTKNARFVVTDKETGHKKYHMFQVTISSSTAGDLIMVLSKYKGKAELSYLRLDKPSNFAVNYYEDRFGKELGTNPKQLYFRMCESSLGGAFANSYGKIMVLVDDQIKLIDKRTLMPDTVNVALRGESYLNNVSYPKPNIDGYKSQYIVEEGIQMWRDGAYGLQLQTYFNEISNGALYFAVHANTSTWAPSYSVNKLSPYNDGPLSPYAFYDEMTPTPHGGLRQAGYACGNLIVFDQRVGRFAYASYGASKQIKTDQIKEYPNYSLVYGSATVQADNTFFAVLRNEANDYKFLLITRKKDETLVEGDKNNVFKVVAEMSMNGGSVITANTKFYTTVRENYLFFTTGNKVYRYNLMNISASKQPGDADVIAKLTDYGYSESDKITSMFISRTEKTLLLGVSRYAESDPDAMSEEIKGDILGFDINNAFNITQNPARTFKGISGIPVDLKVKYATHRRDGLDLSDKLVDNI